MIRITLLSLFLTFSLSAKTLDNKAFCEVIAQGREAADLKQKGLTVKGERLQGEVETKLKTFITVGTQILPDENLRVIKRRGRLPEYVIQCLDIKYSDEMKVEYSSEKKYYKNAGSFWICYQGDKNNCAKNQLTDIGIYEKLEENVQGKSRYNSILGNFVIAPSQYGDLYSYHHIDGLQVHVIISKVESTQSVEID